MIDVEPKNTPTDASPVCSSVTDALNSVDRDNSQCAPEVLASILVEETVRRKASGESQIFVLDNRRIPLMPCRPARAWRLLKAGKASVFRRFPFTIILKRDVDPDPQPVEFKVDPGSRTTGIALVALFPNRGRVVLWAANLHHRGLKIKSAIDRRRALRRGRRARNTRYRAARFDNRVRAKGWLPPSIQSRVDNVHSWYLKLLARVPISEAHIETVRFDMQKIQNPEISGVEYQQGELLGYEIREYLLEKFSRRCAYCGAKDVQLQIEHIKPKALGGTNRVSNLTLACEPCNLSKGKMPIEDFLRKKPDLLSKIKSRAQSPLTDAASVNASRYAIGDKIRSIGLPACFWSGGRTKKNRVFQGYAKDHWIDAACVGESGVSVNIGSVKPISISAIGRGSRQVSCVDKYGFPRGKAGTVKRVFGFSTGDFVRLTRLSGKYAGVWVGIIAGTRKSGYLDIKCGKKKITAKHSEFRLLNHGDGYVYA
jgi:5-methylcytosine-specific restriction endonuclease McrA